MDIGFDFEPSQLHFVMFPLMAPGHMIPMVDMARVIARNGIAVTIITTPVNATRFRRSIYRAIEDGLDLRVVELEFPSKDAGLEDGLENIDMLPSLKFAKNFMVAALKLQDPVEKLLQELKPRPSCMVSDLAFDWTTKLARKFEIPRIVFNGKNCFSEICSHNLLAYNLVERINSGKESSVVVPGLPDRIEVTKAELPSSVNPNPTDVMNDWRDKMREAEGESYGLVVNSFRELEPEYYERYKEAKMKSVWCVGPVSLYGNEYLDKGDRGNNTTAIDRDQCLKWLDLQAPGSVIYACFGSLCDFDAAQIMELSLGLEASNRPFVLVLKGGCDLEEVGKTIDKDGFEERVKGRGLVIRGWAPQVLILSHPAVGGFMTHCGWNSTLEGISAGLPLITWPLFGEQFLNEKLVVQVLRVGVSVRSENRMLRQGEEGIESLAVKVEDITRAVNLVMEEGEQRKGMKERVLRLGESAKHAVEKGGSSNKDLRSMIQEIAVLQRERKRDKLHKQGDSNR